eukprot:SAG11_NODE_1925_length_4056_cov_3.841547_3_plen_204_part_00
MVDYTGIDGPTKPIGFYLERYPVPDDTDLAAFHETLGAHLDALQDVVRKHQNSGWALHECRLNADLRKPVKAALTPSTTTGGITVEEDSNYDPWAFYRALKRFILLTGDGVAIKTHLGYELFGAALSYAGRNGTVLNEDVAEGHGDRDQATGFVIRQTIRMTTMTTTPMTMNGPRRTQPRTTTATTRRNMGLAPRRLGAYQLL